MNVKEATRNLIIKINLSVFTKFLIQVLQIHFYGNEITYTPGQYKVDQRNSNSFYKLLLNKMNAIRFINSFITAL